MDLPLFHVATPLPAGGVSQLIVLLHGYGANERDLYDLSMFFAPGSITLCLRAPLPLDGYQSFAWFEIGITPREIMVDIPQALRSLAQLIACIEQASRAYQVTPEQVYLVGFSQGATMAALAALTRPDLVAGAAILSGIEPTPFLQNPPDLAVLARRQFLVAHGTQDLVVPIEQGHATYAFLQELGANVSYHEYPVGHGINQAGIADLSAWLQAQSV